jgi:hypothetical protein
MPAPCSLQARLSIEAIVSDGPSICPPRATTAVYSSAPPP